MTWMSPESQVSTSETDRLQRVRFASLPPSTPLYTFSVLEWTPSHEVAAHLYPKRRSSVQRIDNVASVGATEEERRDPRDRAVFDSTAGTWTCFRQLSCCGDVLVLEDAAMIDVGPARRHEFTWQQSPGRLPSKEMPNASFGAGGGWKETLASVSQSFSGVTAETVPRETVAGHHVAERREISLQDIHSVRLYCFKHPLPLTFNANGMIATDSSRDDERGSRTRSRQRGTGSSRGSNAEPLEWNYDIWGPVGVIFILRGGRRLFLVFATGQEAAQMRDMLVDFASGRGLQRPSRSSVSLPSTSAANLSATKVPHHGVEEAGNNVSGMTAGSFLSARLPPSPSVSYTSFRLGSCEATSQLPSQSPLLGPTDHAAVSASNGSNFLMRSGVSVSSASSPASPLRSRLTTATTTASASGAVTTSFQPQLITVPSNASVSATHSNFTGVRPSPSAVSPPLSTAAAVAAGTVVMPPVATTRPTPVPRTPPHPYLYCRGWGEAVRHKRYYVKSRCNADTHAAPSAEANAFVRFCRHRLPAWQRIQQTLRHEPRALVLDLRQIYLTPSHAQDTVFRVEAVVDSYTQYRDVLPLGGAVVTANALGESEEVLVARRRELDLCRGRPVVFEALARSKEERTEWLAWLQSRGAALLRSEEMSQQQLPQCAEDSRLENQRASPPPPEARFQPLDSLSDPLHSSKVKAVDRWVSNTAAAAASSSLTDHSPTVDRLSAGERFPQLPLQETASDRGSLRTLQRYTAASPTRYPQPRPHPIAMARFAATPIVVPRKGSTSTDFSGSGQLVDTASAPVSARLEGSTDPFESAGIRKVEERTTGDDFDENAIVVEDDEVDGVPAPETITNSAATSTRLPRYTSSTQVALTSPLSVTQEAPAFLEHTVTPSRGHPPRVQTTHPRRSPPAAIVEEVPTHAESTGEAVSHTHGDDGVMTEPTMTGTALTMAGGCDVALSPMYLDDTSSDEDHPPPPSQRPTAGVLIAARPGFKLFAPFDHLMRQKPPPSLPTPNPNTMIEGRRIVVASATVDAVVPEGGTVRQLAARLANTNAPPNRSSNSRLSITEETPLGKGAPSPPLSPSAVTPPKTPDSFLYNGRTSSGTTMHSRSATAAPRQLNGAQLYAYAQENPSCGSVSPSPDAPAGATPLTNLYAVPLTRQPPSPNTSSVHKALFEDGSLERTSSLKVREVGVNGLVAAQLVGSHANKNDRGTNHPSNEVTSGSDDRSNSQSSASGRYSSPYASSAGSKRARATHFDPRLTPFLTQSPHLSMLNGGKPLSSAAHVREFSFTDDEEVDSALQGQGKDSSVDASLLKLRQTDATLGKGKRVSTLSRSVPQPPFDSRDRSPSSPSSSANKHRQHSYTALEDEDVEVSRSMGPHLNAVSRGASHHSSEAARRPLGYVNLDVVEQRKRAFRESLFIHQL